MLKKKKKTNPSPPLRKKPQESGEGIERNQGISSDRREGPRYSGYLDGSGANRRQTSEFYPLGGFGGMSGVGIRRRFQMVSVRKQSC